MQQAARVTESDQAQRLRELVRRGCASRAKVVAITSGKGGVGKTNIAVNMSVQLAATGARVVLIDVDMGLANADLLLNVQARYSLSHVLSGVRDITEVAVPGPSGMRFVAGASGVHQLANLSEFERQRLISSFRRLETSADIIILDCGAGIGRNVISFAQAADRILVVTTPQPTALTDGYAIIKALHRERYCGQLGVFVNMAKSRSEAVGAFERVSRVANKFLNYVVADDGYMLHDTSVELAVLARCPFVIRSPESNSSACVAALANRMYDQSHKRASDRKHRGGLLSRVAGLFV